MGRNASLRTGVCVVALLILWTPLSTAEDGRVSRAEQN